jgi:hypothetical protein
MAAAQASKSVEEVWAHAKMAEEDKHLADADWREGITASCPKCGAPQATNARFCAQCGADLKTAGHCTQCGPSWSPTPGSVRDADRRSRERTRGRLEPRPSASALGRALPARGAEDAGGAGRSCESTRNVRFLQRDQRHDGATDAIIVHPTLVSPAPTW